jgi:alkanesulfonate monooxygenase SsuD/methylene tetrahydromethanopterin reductase-like flavin-dependent oxidoreductase (luciferase family)
VRVFEDFATVDLLSSGRAEIIAGRGVFTESFPLFGFDVAHQDALFEEKIALLLQLGVSERVTWQGRFRAPLKDAAISPRPVQNPLPVWVGTGGTPESVVRAGRLGLPLALANISKPPASLAPLAQIYRDAGREAGHPPEKLRISIASHGFLQRDSQAALDVFFPHYAAYARNHVPSQYKAREITRADYERLAGPDGPLFVGSPQQLVDKILWERELFGHDRFLLQVDVGGVPFLKVAEAIELLATEVAPALRRAA